MFSAIKNSIIYVFVICISTVAVAFAEQFTNDQKTEIEAIIQDYLINNPEVIEKAQEEINRRREEEAQLRAEKLISDKEGLLFSSTKQAVMGNPEGDITLIEFFDYNCGFCRRSFADILKIIEEDDQVQVILKEFPILGEQSIEAAEVSIAANILDPSSYPEFHQKLMLSRNRSNSAYAIAVAEDVGYDIEAIKKMTEAPEVQAAIEEVYELARNLSLTGTPAFVLGTEVIRGAISFDQLKAKIASLRRCGSTFC